MSTAASPQASDRPASPAQPSRPPGRWAVVVMGVSGTGKSSVAEGIAAALGLACVDGDHLHAPESVAKMKAGTPLCDADRWPWLDRIGACLCDAAAEPAGVAVSCSALRRAYRDRLRAAAPHVRFVFLDGSPELIRTRMVARRDHYMPPGLLDSQMQTLERPGFDEPGVLPVNIEAPLATVISQAVALLRRAMIGERPLSNNPELKP